MPRIMIVEDEPAIAEVLQYNLELEGFEVRVRTRGDDALNALQQEPADLILLDIMLPGMDGLEVTRHLKRSSSTADVPLVMITARDSETDRIVGLELGADDYVTKPFSPREVVLRVKAVLRRSSARDGPGEVLELGEIRLDLGAREVRIGDEPVELTATEYRLLRLLMERVGRAQSRAQLLQNVWNYHAGIESRTVDTHVRRLRGKLGSSGERIETVVGFGYRFRG